MTFIKYIVDCGNRWFVSHKLNWRRKKKRLKPFDMPEMEFLKILSQFSFDDFVCEMQKNTVISICCGFKFTDAIIYLCKIENDKESEGLFAMRHNNAG